MKPKVFAVVLNWNEKELTEKCLNSLIIQTHKPEIVVVDNGSVDGSDDYLKKKFPKIEIVRNKTNLGFAGGANSGIRYCLDSSADFIALVNNDAWLEKNWIGTLLNKLGDQPKLAIAAGLLLKTDKKTVDSSGDQYSSWGLPIARQRDVLASEAIAKDEQVFGATAGACIYRADALRQVGLFDEKFFAYYEDTDLNFQMQLAGWKILYTPEAVGYHAIGGTSGKMPGFTVFQTIKNLPMLFFKDVPLGLMPRMLPRFSVVYCGLFVRALLRGHVWLTLKAFLLLIKNIPHIARERYKIQRNRKVSNDYIWLMLYKDLPPNSHKLHKIRSFLTFGKY